MSFNDVSLVEGIIHSFQEGDWKNVIEQQASLNGSYFLWPRPKKDDLDFITDSVKKVKLSSIVSIGCGTGLLEWLITASSGVNVVGIEVDKIYWTSKYARKHFIELVFTDDENVFNIIEGENKALMFCYFNNKDAFLKYLEIYKGNCLIIIGPHNIGRHTDPGPFDPDIPSDWTHAESREIGNTGDFIVIYKRSPA